MYQLHLMVLYIKVLHIYSNLVYLIGSIPVTATVLTVLSVWVSDLHIYFPIVTVNLHVIFAWQNLISGAYIVLVFLRLFSDWGYWWLKQIQFPKHVFLEHHTMGNIQKSSNPKLQSVSDSEWIAVESFKTSWIYMKSWG